MMIGRISTTLRTLVIALGCLIVSSSPSDAQNVNWPSFSPSRALLTLNGVRQDKLAEDRRCKSFAG